MTQSSGDSQSRCLTELLRWYSNLRHCASGSSLTTIPSQRRSQNDPRQWRMRPPISLEMLPARWYREAWKWCRELIRAGLARLEAEPSTAPSQARIAPVLPHDIRVSCRRSTTTTCR